MGKTSPTSFSLMDEKHHMNKSIDCASMLTLLPIYANCHKSPENSDESCLCTSGKVSQRYKCELRNLVFMEKACRNTLCGGRSGAPCAGRLLLEAFFCFSVFPKVFSELEH